MTPVKMMHAFRAALAVSLSAFCACAVCAAPPAPSNRPATPAAPAVGATQPSLAFSGTVTTYDPLKTFAPVILPDPVNAYRSSNGAPGPAYWQNGADYEIHAKLDTVGRMLSADEVITYTNNSPDALSSLWIQLDQNIYRKDSRSVSAGGWARSQFTEGFILDSVDIDSATVRGRTDYVISDTRMQVRLSQPLTAHGGHLKIRIHYHYAIPGEFGGRTSWVATPRGEIYDMAQWYPRMAVYDDLRGWDTQPYLGSEFYLEYGRFDYFVTVPSDMLVAGSGELQNPTEVLSKTALQRLDSARNSDRTVIIRGPDEVSAPGPDRPPAGGSLTWHFRMDHTRDVAFSASRAFIWDAARIALPDGARSLAMSFYPAESAGDAAWGRSTEYLKHSVEEFSRRWFVYPYPAAVNVAGGSSGMEYPGILFDGIEDKGKELFWITAHEIGHTWFPMIVGFNERRHAWMDEGFNTFIDVYESDAFAAGIYGPKRDSEYAPGGGNPVEEIVPILSDPEAPILLTPADAIKEKYRHPVTYFKSALGLVLLREQILGPQRFDWAFRKFIRDWAFKHPSPSDFFRAMESEGGEDLAWFWRGWYMQNWTLDFAVESVSESNGATHITIVNHGQLVMPTTVLVTDTDGAATRIALPVETWIQKTAYTIDLPGPRQVASVVLDPDHVIPDRNRNNNSWSAAPAPAAR
jgi:hypothetical protein